MTLAAVASGHRFIQGIEPGALAEDLGQGITLERGRQDVAAERDFGVVGPGYPAALRRGKGPRRASNRSILIWPAALANGVAQCQRLAPTIPN